MITTQEGLEILHTPAAEIPALLARAQQTRLEHYGGKVVLCGIANVKSGACTEDCAFCAQSVHHSFPGLREYGLDLKPVLEYAFAESRVPLDRFGLVTSGCRLAAEDLSRVEEALREFSQRKMSGERLPEMCASLGCLTGKELARLKDAGLSRYHHNLETAESFFPRVCTTHTYRRRVETVLAAKDAGLEVCCGGVFGLGETAEQRVELARQVAALAVDDIPLNFLVPIPGTPMENALPVPPLDILRITALFRIACPASGVRVCAGRAKMGPLQSLLFYAGATGLMVGDLLTTAGGEPEADMRMLRDLGIIP